MLCLREEKKNNRKATCENCKKEFLKYSAELVMKYCSRACSAKVNGAKKTKAQTIETVCGWCKKPIIRRLSAKGITGDFCSIPCGEAFKRGNDEMFIAKNCLRCNKEYETLFRRQTDYCSKQCSSLYQPGENHSGYGKEGPTKGIKPWTFGLTKETDTRLSDLGNKVSKTQKEQFTSGIRSNHKKHNPNWGKTREDRTMEQLENYSKAAIERIRINPSIGSNRYCLRGVYNSSKAGKEMNYRSSYELRLMRCFDIDEDVIYYTYEELSLKLDTGKRYLPDFIVIYRDGSKRMIEAKGWITDPELHELKCKTAYRYCNENNIKYEVWKLQEIKNYELQLGVN
jgi:hypothetical protein